MDPDMFSDSSLIQDVTMTTGGSTRHPYLHGNITLEQQHGAKWQPRNWASAWPLMVLAAMDISTDPEYSKATAVALGTNTLASGNNMGYSDQHGIDSGKTPGYQHGHKL